MKTLCLMLITVLALHSEENRTLPLPYEKASEGKSAYTLPSPKVEAEAERMIQRNGALKGATGEPMHSFEPPHHEDSSGHKGH